MKRVIHVGDKCVKDIKIRVIVLFRRCTLRCLLPVSSTKFSENQSNFMYMPNIIDLFVALVELITKLSALSYFLYDMCHSHFPNKKSS